MCPCRNKRTHSRYCAPASTRSQSYAPAQSCCSSVSHGEIGALIDKYDAKATMRALIADEADDDTAPAAEF